VSGIGVHAVAGELAFGLLTGVCRTQRRLEHLIGSPHVGAAQPAGHQILPIPLGPTLCVKLSSAILCALI
jgi:hypothetical protein